MQKTRRVLRQLLGAAVLGGAGGAMIGALIGLIVSDLLTWWDRGVVIVVVLSLGALAGIVASILGGDAESDEDDA
ncbi:MAG TPA: hypothetical protein VFS30_18510 [Dehalococcoidia bacterium]|nr:hypothetical protein [Dehalococcoidia bacterium]